MRRRLIVMRHAKSSWKDGSLTDHQRPLNERGRKAAARIARTLGELGWLPRRVLSSDAERTRQTLQRMNSALDTPLAHELLPSLYLGGLGDLQAAVSACPDDLASVLVLGHNPGSESSVAWLTGTAVQMTTANAALLEGEGPTWAEAVQAAGAWRLVGLLRPRELSS